jgi:hypothetical protein
LKTILGGTTMKKLLILVFLVSTSLMLGACSNEKVGGAKADKDETKQEIIENEQKENVLVFEVDGKEVEVDLTEAEVQPQLAKKVYLPEGFETKQVNEKQFEAIGTGEYQDINVFVQNGRAMPDVEKQIYDWSKFVTAAGGPGTEIKEIELKEYPVLKEKYNYVAEVKNGNGGTKYAAFKMGDETTFVYVSIFNEEKQITHKDFALELIKKIQLAEPA